MKKLIMFKNLDCEYCRMAEKYFKQIIQKKPEYQEIVIQIIDENKEVDFSMKFDYKFVPAFFVDHVKIHEGITTFQKAEEILAHAYAAD